MLLAMDGSNTDASNRKVEADREGESSTKKLKVTMGVETLDCPVCFEPLRPPILQCSVGHFICSPCCVKLDKKCPVCSIETSFNRCFGMEHVVQEAKIACSNHKYGCAEKVTYYKKEEHKKACPYVPCFCPEQSLVVASLDQQRCSWTISPPNTSVRQQPSQIPARCLFAYNQAYMSCDAPATFSCSAWHQSLLDMPSQSSASNQKLWNPSSNVIWNTTA